MPGGIHWHSRPQDIIAAAKARAKAALKEQNPRLTSLERAFYEAYKRQEG